jgi:hypothetical protein
MGPYGTSTPSLIGIECSTRVESRNFAASSSEKTLAYSSYLGGRVIGLILRVVSSTLSLYIGIIEVMNII